MKKVNFIISKRRNEKISKIIYNFENLTFKFLDENGNKGLEEERRLGYVGITRARKNLYISYVNFRKQYNYSIYRSIPSRFLSELPDDNCKVLKISTQEKGDKQKLTSLVNTKFDIGDKVSHDQFGKGLVLGIYDDQLHIRFENDDKITKIFSDYVKKL